LEEVSYADFSRCSTCNYEGNLGHWFLLKVRTKDKVSAAISLEAIWDWHLPVAAVVNVRNAWFGCKCCDHRYYGGQERFEVTIDGLEGEMGLGTHIGSVHYITDLQKLLSNGVGVCPCKIELGVGHFSNHQLNCPATQRARQLHDQESRAVKNEDVFGLFS
jgi:hypothetical protein